MQNKQKGVSIETDAYKDGLWISPGSRDAQTDVLIPNIDNINLQHYHIALVK